MRAAPARLAAILMIVAGGVPTDASAQGAAARLVQDTVFRHDDHTAYDCLQCHASTGDHGSLLVRTIQDCRACHHSLPVAEPCSDCHAGAERSPQLFELPRLMTVAQGRTAGRLLPFQHSSHEAVACSSCHVSGPEFNAESVQCTSCHVEHHGSESDCSVCHVEPPTDVHPLEVHAGCSGSTCHADPTLDRVSESRSFCLVCHRDQVEHVPGKSCAMCHLVPHPDLR